MNSTFVKNVASRKDGSHEQTRQLTTPKARHGHDAIPGAQTCAEIACIVG